MTKAEDVFVNCDVLDAIPMLNRHNYNYETAYLAEELPHGARVLQVGSMDGTRAVRLLSVRPDLKFTGLEIDPSLVDLATVNVKGARVDAEFIRGDITSPPDLPAFDYVVCLNHTLGYISDEAAAIAGMRTLGANVLISVYGETFDEVAAREYFECLGLAVEQVTESEFRTGDGWRIKRFGRADAEAWGGHVVQTPLGYLVTLG